MMKKTTPSADEPACPIGKVVTRWVRRKEARPGEILDAALDLFVAKGFSATKMEDIARAAGVTAGTLYRYYGNKEALLKAVIHESFSVAFVEAEQLLADFEGTGAALLETVIRTWWRLHGATRMSGIPKLIIAEAANFPDLAKFHSEEVVARGETFVIRAIEYGIARGEFRPVDTQVFVKVVTAPIVMAMVWQHSDGCNTTDWDVDLYLDAVIESLVFGLAVRPGNPAR